VELTSSGIVKDARVVAEPKPLVTDAKAGKVVSTIDDDACIQDVLMHSPFPCPHGSPATLRLALVWPPAQ